MKVKHQYSSYSLIPICLFCLLGSISCIVIHLGGRTEPSEDKAIQTPQIIFLNYSIKLDKSKQEPEIQLINIITAEGKLKKNSSDQEIPKPGDLKCITLNNNLEPIDSMIISDPLNITVESIDGNNSLFKKEIARDSAQFSIRLQLTKEIQSIAIKKNSNSDNQNTYLLITKIKEP
jgi:hypothetical protein